MEPQDQALKVEEAESQEQEPPKVSEKPKKSGVVKRAVISVMGGDVFLKDGFVNLFPFFLYIVFLLMLYITNIYIAEDMGKEMSKTNRRIEDLHVEYVYLKSEITKITKQSTMVNMLKAKGIKESVDPLRKIVVEKEGGHDD